MFSSFSSFMQSIKNTIINSGESHNATFNPLDNISRNCIIYVRASTKEQNLEAQAYSCEEFCFKHKLYIRQVISEKCTAFKDNSQKGLKKIIEDNENINIVVYSIDRFSRNVTKATQLIQLMESKKINLISVKENISLSTAFGKHEFRKLVSASQFEAELISERVSNSVKYRKAHGIHMGSVPYGYTVFDKKLARDNSEQLVIKFILSTVKKTTTTEKLNNTIKKLLADLKKTKELENFTPVVITLEDDQYEYRTLSPTEKFSPTMKSVSEILNDYGIKKKTKLWTVSSVNYLIKQQMKNNQREFENMRM